MASVAFQLLEEVTAHAQSDSLEDAREICAGGTYFSNNLRKILPQKPTGLQLVFPAFYAKRRFITAFTSAHNLSLNRARSIRRLVNRFVT